MFNKKLKLMTSIDAEDWFLNFINKKLECNEKNDGVLILAMRDIRKELIGVGYNKNLIDDNTINKVLNRNNFIYKKVNGSYIIVDCIKNKLSKEILHKTIENEIEKDYETAKKLKNLGVFLILCTFVMLVSKMLNEGFSLNYVSKIIMVFFQGIIYIRLSKVEENKLLKLKSNLSL